jgi:predicted nucleotidyltransferase
LYNFSKGLINMTLIAPTIDNRTRIPEEIIQELIARIADEFQPIKIILFGSYAQGNPRPESDVDLLVVMETSLREIEQAVRIRQHIKPMFGVDILVYTPARLEQRVKWGDSFLKEITEKGVVVYESPDP